MEVIPVFAVLLVIAVACPEVIPVLAVFNATASNEAFDITPDTLAVAAGITAFVPSEDVIVLAPVEPDIPKFVVTLVALAVLAVIADACADVIPVFPLLVVIADACAVVIPVFPLFVVMFDACVVVMPTLPLLVVIAEAWPELIVVVLPAFAVDAVVPIAKLDDPVAPVATAVTLP